MASIEINFTADYMDYTAEWARRYEGEIIQSDRANEHIYLYKSAIGVIGGILPWNFSIFLNRKEDGTCFTNRKYYCYKAKQ